MNRKKIIIGGGILAAAIATVAILPLGKEEETTYREIKAEYGSLVVGITESGSVDIGTVEQTFELDMSALTRVSTENSSSQGSSMPGGMSGGMGSMPGGSSPSMGGGVDMFTQVFGMVGQNNTAAAQDNDSPLTIEEVCVAVGQQVEVGDTLYILEESGVADLTEELSGNVELAKKDLDVLLADQELSKQTAEITYQINQEYGDYALTEKEQTITELQNAVTTKSKELAKAKENLATYQENLSSAKTELEKAQEALSGAEYSRSNTDEEDVFSYTYYFSQTQEWQSTVSTLEQKVEQLENNIEQCETNIETTEKSLAQAKRDLAKGLLSAENTYQLRLLAYENAQETYDITMAYLEEDLLAQEEVYAEASEKWEEFSSHIAGNEVQAKYNGVITSVDLAKGDSLTTGAVVVTLYNTDDVSMTVTIEEEDMEAIAIGGKANIAFTAYPDSIYTAQVTDIADPETDSSGTTTYDVTVTLQGDVSGLFHGMTGEITFITKETKEVVHVLNRAIIRDGKKSYVKVKDEKGKVKTVEVVTGFSDGSSVEIIEGLKEGDTVLVESKVSES